MIQARQTNQALITLDELYRAFIRAKVVNEDLPQVREEFQKSVDRVAATGLVQRFSWGNYLLLKPELLDAYASALVNAARDEPDGLGSIKKSDALAGSFDMPVELKGQAGRDTEQLLLLAMVEELIRRDLALIQETQEGEFLVFPAQTTITKDEFPDPSGQAVRYEFEGAVTNLYTTLAVRLARSRVFTRPEIYSNAIQYDASTGGKCGLLLTTSGNGAASLTVFFSSDTPDNNSVAIVVR